MPWTWIIQVHDACDMRCLMDKVYQQKDVGLVMGFVYEASNLMSGPTA